MSVVQRLVAALRAASVHNPAVQASPACILWPDGGRQWESAVPRLLSEIPELLVLGEYAPQRRTGPAIWLRCVISGKADDVPVQAEKPPILYLPGVSRQDLRAVESCPEHLKPLAELQFRGVIWSQVNAKDWTILAFLKSDQGGLGLDVAQDGETRSAVQVALNHLLDEEVERLRGRRLDKDYFNTLLTGGDPVRDLLQWLDDANAFRRARGADEWKAFVGVCKSQLGFSPETSGELAGAAKLAAGEGPWHPAWERYREAPKRYPLIPQQLRKCSMPPTDLLSDWRSHGSWPQWNEKQEEELRTALTRLDRANPAKARSLIQDLEKRHGPRRNLVWAELGESPLAAALEHLAVLAWRTRDSLAAGTTDDLASAYLSSGVYADDALLRCLACVHKSEDVEALTVAVRAVYLPWAEESARYLQEVVSESGYPGETAATMRERKPQRGECFLFVDGLRLDVARRLTELLVDRGRHVGEKLIWAALPTVTATGKPAVSPVRYQLGGEEANADFEPCVAETRQPLTGYRLKKLLEDSGWSALNKSSLGGGDGSAWFEVGNFDREGHERGWRLAKYLEALLEELRDQIERLFEAGWKTVRVVTDHGWLLLPGGLPKIELPSALVENKWGRCAVIKSGAATDERLFPWFWNPHRYFALADGVSCFKKGREYAHGGLSLQECLTLELQVEPGETRSAASIREVVWRGLRCRVAAEGALEGLLVDIRREPGDPGSSVVMGRKPFSGDGTCSVVVENEDDDGRQATVVLIGPDGELVSQVATRIGGGAEE